MGFCVPDGQTLAILKAVGFITDNNSQMVRTSEDLLYEAMSTLPRDISLYSRGGQEGLDFKRHSYFVGAGTPVNVQDLDNDERRAATRPGGGVTGINGKNASRQILRDKE